MTTGEAVRLIMTADTHSMNQVILEDLAWKSSTNLGLWHKVVNEIKERTVSFLTASETQQKLCKFKDKASVSLKLRTIWCLFNQVMHKWWI